MGNKNSYFKDINLKSTYFSIEEILYLNNNFNTLSNGENKLYIGNLINEELWSAKLKRKMLNIFDKNEDGYLEFDEYKNLCGILLRGCLEIKLEMIFEILRDRNEEYLDKNKTKDKLIEYTKQLTKTKITRTSEKEIKVRKADVVGDFIYFIFHRVDQVDRTEYLRNALTCPSAFFLLKMMEKMIRMMTDEMDLKLKTHIYKLPLMNIVSIEGNRVPNAVSTLCEQIKKTISPKDYDVTDKIHSLEKDEEMNLCEAIVNSFHCGFSNQVDLQEVSLSVLLFSLKSVLSSFPAPLLTFILSKKLLTDALPEKGNEIQTLKLVLQTIPLCYRETVLCIVDTIHFLFSKVKSPSIFDCITHLFATCFFEIKQEVYFQKAALFVRFLFEHANQFCSSFKKTEMDYFDDSDSCENSSLDSFLDEANENIKFLSSSPSNVIIELSPSKKCSKDPLVRSPKFLNLLEKENLIF